MAWPRALAVLALLAAAGGMALAAEIRGRADVIDGDTLVIAGRTIRLDGIDAPETGQICERDGRVYDCGQEAAWALAERIERHWVTCILRDVDAAATTPAVCRLPGPEIDVAAHMVRQGWALAVGDSYAAEEAAAQRERRGLWAGRFVAPWDWRAGRR